MSIKFYWFLIGLLMNVFYDVHAKKNTYALYHNDINRAESFFFLNQQVDSALYYYDRAFSAYDFVFVRDLLNAAQISIFSGRPFEAYLLRSFEMGIEWSDLERFPLIKPQINKLFKQREIQSKVAAHRKQYLSRIKLDDLSYVYDLGILDQIEKNKSAKEYEAFLDGSIKKFKERIEREGFPGAKLIGIESDTTFARVGKPSMDLTPRRSKKSSNISYYSIDRKLLGATKIIIFLVHHPCSFFILEPLLKKAVESGEIHPREVGLLFDHNMHMHHGVKKNTCNKARPSDGLFYLNPFCDYKKIHSTEEKTDALRKQWYIAPLKIDQAKEAFEKQHQFVLSYGLWNCQ